MDRDRLVAFVERDYPRVVAAVAVTCGDRAWAEDAVQDVLAGLVGRDVQVDHLPGWVVTSAVNGVRSSARRRAAEGRALDRLRRLPSPSSPSGPADPDDAALDALRTLPERQRQIAALHYLLDMSVADVAATMHISEGTVKTQLHRARESMRVHLEPGQDRKEDDHVGR
jgi:RNA polymerase sigma-70 factor (ECF subfamily)